MTEGVDLEQAALQATRHWLDAAVVGLNLCPFAKAPLVKDQVRIVVNQSRHADGWLDQLDSELDLLVATSADEIETTLLVHPTLFADSFLDFNDFMEVAEGIVEEHGLEGVVQLAFFHPLFQFEGTEENAMENYTNRAPYATMHLLREDSIDRAVSSPLDADTIVQNNIATLNRLGLAGWKALGF